MLKDIYKFLAFVALIFPVFSYCESIKINGFQNGGIKEYQGFIECQGSIFPQRTAVYKLSKGGEVMRLFVEEGQKIKKGQPLFELYSGELLGRIVTIKDQLYDVEKRKSRIKHLDVNVEVKKKQLSLAKKSLAHHKEIAAKLSDQEAIKKIEEITNNVLILESEVDLLQREYLFLEDHKESDEKIAHLLKKNLGHLLSEENKLSPLAPFDGTVKRVRKKYGPNFYQDTILEVWDTSRYLIKATLSQHQVQYVKVGSKVKIFPQLYSTDHLMGRVKEILPPVYGQQDKLSISEFPIIIELERADKSIVNGLNVAVKIFGDEP